MSYSFNLSIDEVSNITDIREVFKYTENGAIKNALQDAGCVRLKDNTLNTSNEAVRDTQIFGSTQSDIQYYNPPKFFINGKNFTMLGNATLDSLT